MTHKHKHTKRNGNLIELTLIVLDYTDENDMPNDTQGYRKRD